MQLLFAISDLYKDLNSTTVILLSVAMILFSGFIISRLTKMLKLPNVTGYIIAGILIGPNIFGFVPQNVVTNMTFMNDIALAFIAFGVGKFFKKEVLKKTGPKIIIVTLMESIFAGIIVTAITYFVFDLSFEFCLILGAIATATAPASTMMTINQYHARGNFVDTLLQVIAFDNVVCLIIFSIVTSIVKASTVGAVVALDVALPIIYNLSSVLVGFLLGLILGKLVRHRSQDSRLIIVVALLVGLAGLCGALDISPLLCCMMFGATYINFTKDKEVFNQLSNFTPPVMAIFFVVSGLNLNISSLATVGIVGFVYFILRIIGKYVGAYLGCKVVNRSIEERRFLGLALIPQAGVAIGLAFLSQRLFPGDMGNTLLTIILASSVMYELIGPVCAKASLFLSGTVKPESGDAVLDENGNVIIDEKPKAIQLDIDSIGEINNTNEEVHEMTRELSNIDGVSGIVEELQCNNDNQTIIDVIVEQPETPVQTDNKAEQNTTEEEKNDNK